MRPRLNLNVLSSKFRAYPDFSITHTKATVVPPHNSSRTGPNRFTPASEYAAMNESMTKNGAAKIKIQNVETLTIPEALSKTF